MDAIVEQIQETMNPEQTVAIDAMQFTSEDIRQLMMSLRGDEVPEGFDPSTFPGGEMPFRSFDDGNDFRPPEGFAGREGGIVVGGGTIGPGLGEGFGGVLAPEAQATMEAMGGPRRGIGVSPFMFDAVIKLLEDKLA